MINDLLQTSLCSRLGVLLLLHRLLLLLRPLLLRSSSNPVCLVDVKLRREKEERTRADNMADRNSTALAPMCAAILSRYFMHSYGQFTVDSSHLEIDK